VSNYRVTADNQALLTDTLQWRPSESKILREVVDTTDRLAREVSRIPRDSSEVAGIGMEVCTETAAGVLDPAIVAVVLEPAAVETEALDPAVAVEVLEPAAVGIGNREDNSEVDSL